MKQQWRKLGHIYSPAGESSWMHSHAAVPFCEQLADNIFRVYFTTRDTKRRSHTAFVDIELEDSAKVINVSAEPVLLPGRLGEFDDSGAMGCWLTTVGENRFCYYQGWNLGVTVPFRNSIGVAISTAGSEFKRFSPGPIIDRSMFEPHFTATPCVITENGLWRMWYLSCTQWDEVNGTPKHRYHIKYAESADGINWVRDGKIAIDYSGPDEYAISRPSVIHDADGWKMWYSYRGASYRIGFAVSEDGITWVRRDHEAGIDVSIDGWDSEMIEYPFVFDHRGKRYMLYNGNDYGRSGFGLAVMEK